MNKYDIGTMFSLTNDNRAIKAMVNYAINDCIENDAIIGNVNVKK